jgi:hypothetical protein
VEAQQERDLGTDLIFGTDTIGSDHIKIGAELFVKRKLSNPEDFTHGSTAAMSPANAKHGAFFSFYAMPYALCAMRFFLQEQEGNSGRQGLVIRSASIEKEVSFFF